MARLRQDIASLGPTWNSTMLWFARGVAALQQRPLNDRRSWTYLAAIHGLDLNGWIGAGVVPPAPPMPPPQERTTVWNQCQHAGWYFLPWHRGYLYALESILAAKILELGGPDDWALPYWNYLGSAATARDYPQAFVDASTPDGTPNPLRIQQRGPGTVLGPKPWVPRDIGCSAMNSHRFTSAPGTLGFGGGQTGFEHFDNSTGAEEANPHNLVHVMIGGPNGGPTGFMGDPNYAALDPIFWVHHCNIDRMWAAWLTVAGNVQENGAAWSGGPNPRRFVMPDASGNLNVFTPGQTLPGQLLAPTYDSLAGACIAALPAGVDDDEDATMPATLSDAPPPEATLVGASSESLTVGSERKATTVAFAPEEAVPAGDPVEQRLFLNLENVRGAAPSGVLNVYLSPHSGGEPILADTVALFGLQKASESDTGHGGNGLSIAIDITDLTRTLAAQGDDLDRLDVHIEQPDENSGEPITVDRVSVYRQPVEDAGG